MHESFAQSVLAAALAALRPYATGGAAGDKNDGFTTLGAVDDRRRSTDGVEVTSRSSRSATRSRAATCSSRSRTGSRSRDERQRTVDVFVNHETSTVPFPFTGDRRRLQRLHERDGEQAAPEPERRRSARGRVRHPVGGELPALLLELPRHRGARLRPRAALHERGGDRLGLPHRRSAWPRPRAR